MNRIDEMLQMAEITDIKDIPVPQTRTKSELGIFMKPKILHRGHVKKKLEGIFSTPLFFIVSGMGSGKTTAV